MTQTFEFDVKMSCQGCADTVKKGLEPLIGIQAIDMSVEDQTVPVTANAEVLLDDVFKAIQATGKEVKNGRVKDDRLF